MKKCIEIRIMLFKNCKHAFEWVYQIRPKCLKEKIDQESIKSGNRVFFRYFDCTGFLKSYNCVNNDNLY